MPVVSTTKMTAGSTMRAIATQDLSSLSLDSAAQQIHAVTVNGAPAEFRTPAKSEKLVITPGRTLRRGRPFQVTVRYTADRSQNPTSPAYHLGKLTWPMKSWVSTPHGFAFMGQPDRAHLFFPSDDVPSDKALFTFHVRTPDGVFSLEEVECMGACSWAPAVEINYDFHHFVTPEKLDEILDSLRKTQ